MGKKRNTDRILVGNPEGTRPLGRQRRRLVENIKMNLTEIGWDGVDWIDMAHDRGLIACLSDKFKPVILFWLMLYIKNE
jgi:hypothetical protein